MTDWTTADQRRHRAELLAALDGPADGDDAWQRATTMLWGTPPPPRPRKVYDRSRVQPADHDQPSAVCPTCLAGAHGPACDGCACRCRATLGLEGPFDIDPTAPDPADQMGEVA